MSRSCSRVLVQEFVDGEGTGYFALMHQGELRVEFAHRRIRDVHPTGSGSAVRVSVEPDPQVRAASLAILQALHWHGVAMVEFRQVPGSAPVFMEVNGRFWNSLPLACYAEADFPALLAQIAETGDVVRENLEKQNSFRTGVRPAAGCWEIFGIWSKCGAEPLLAIPGLIRDVGAPCWP